jgi:chaperone required for assembly of F1-ATPase
MPILTTITKRFYTSVTLEKRNEYYALLLDGAPVQITDTQFLASSSLSLMQAVQAEWEAQQGAINLENMHLTRLVVAMQDAPMRDMAEIHTEILHYALHEMSAMRAPDIPALYAAQEMHYPPLLAWASQHFGVKWRISEALIPPVQPQEVSAAVQKWLLTLSPQGQMLCMVLCQTLTSFVLAAATLLRVCDPETAVAASWLEHDIQMAKWGEDAVLLEKRERILAEVRASLLCAASLELS